MLSLIVAHAKNFIIGNKGGMPWHLPADLSHFKKTTMGHPVIMGRKTFVSIGRALPGRLNIVISRNEALELPDGVILCQSLTEAIKKIPEEQEAFVIGGGSIYEEAISLADRLYLTIIDAQIEGDTSFPKYELGDYNQIEKSEYVPDEKNCYHLTFLTLEKK